MRTPKGRYQQNRCPEAGGQLRPLTMRTPRINKGNPHRLLGVAWALASVLACASGPLAAQPGNVDAPWPTNPPITAPQQPQLANLPGPEAPWPAWAQALAQYPWQAFPAEAQANLAPWRLQLLAADTAPPALLQAKLATALGEPQAALLLLDSLTAAAPAPTRLAATLGRATLLYNQGQLPLAEAAYTTWLGAAGRRHPQAAIAWLGRGLARFGMGQYAAAADDCRQAGRANPSWAAPPYHLGNALALTGAYSKAIKAYQEALALDATLAPAHLRLGEALRRQGQPAQACAAFAQAAQLGSALGLAYQQAYCGGSAGAEAEGGGPQ